MPRCLRSSVKRSDLEKAELELQGIQKSKKKLLPRVKRKKYSKKSHELHNAIEKNQDSLEIEIERLKLDSDRSLVWDNQWNLSSPLKDTSYLLNTFFRFVEDQDSPPPALSRERSVSVSGNRSSYLTLESDVIVDIQPVCRNLNQRFNDSRPS